MNKLLLFLSGNKGMIVAIIAIIITYMLKENIISANLALMLEGILGVIAKGTSIATAQMYKNK